MGSRHGNSINETRLNRPELSQKFMWNPLWLPFTKGGIQLSRLPKAEIQLFPLRKRGESSPIHLCEGEIPVLSLFARGRLQFHPPLWKGDRGRFLRAKESSRNAFIYQYLEKWSARFHDSSKVWWSGKKWKMVPVSFLFTVAYYPVILLSVSHAKEMENRYSRCFTSYHT